MDFQKILELASKNQKVNEKKVKETKRYSSKVPPPKKEPRPAVDPDAIRARIEQKEKDKQQKLIDAERERKEGAARQVELDIKLATEKRENRRKSRKAKPSPDPKTKKTTSSEDSSRRGESSGYRDREHEVVHKTFMQRVQKDADKHRVKESKKETAVRPPKPKPKKKAAPAPKKPMSYEELLKFAEHQKAGSSSKRDEPEESEDEDSEEEESEDEDYDRRPRSRDMGSFNKNRDQSRESKVKARLKEERSRNIGHSSNHKHIPEKHGKTTSQSFNTKDRNRPAPDLIKNGKGSRQSSEAERNIIRKGSGPSSRDVIRKEGRVDASRKPIDRGDRVGGGGEDRRKVNGSVPSRAGEKKPYRTADRPVSKAVEKTSGSGDKRAVRPSDPQAGRSSDKLPRRPDSKVPPRPGGRPESRPQGRPESRPVPGKSSRPGGDRDHPRPTNHDRERPRPSPAMGPPRGQEVVRKRPAKPPIMHVKRGRIMVSDSEESDYDDGDGFIDDTPLDDGRGGDVSSYIKEIFGYDKSKYGYESDYALRAMDTSYKDIQREESRSARLGMLEDLEDMRKEKEDMKKKTMKKGKKR